MLSSHIVVGEREDIATSNVVGGFQIRGNSTVDVALFLLIIMSGLS